MRPFRRLWRHLAGGDNQPARVAERAGNELQREKTVPFERAGQTKMLGRSAREAESFVIRLVAH